MLINLWLNFSSKYFKLTPQQPYELIVFFISTSTIHTPFFIPTLKIFFDIIKSGVRIRVNFRMIIAP